MPKIKKLTSKYTELYREYQEFLIINKLKETDVLQVNFIYSTKFYNKNCLICNPKLTEEECSMYNLTVDIDGEWIIVDNEHSKIYVQLTNKIVVSFRCGQECLQSKNNRLLNQAIIGNDNISNKHYYLLKKELFL